MQRNHERLSVSVHVTYGLQSEGEGPTYSLLKLMCTAYAG